MHNNKRCNKIVFKLCFNVRCIHISKLTNDSFGATIYSLINAIYCCLGQGAKVSRAKVTVSACVEEKVL